MTTPSRNIYKNDNGLCRLFGLLFCLFLLLTLGVEALPVSAAPSSQTVAPTTIQVLQNTARVVYRTGVEFRISVTTTGPEITKATLKVKYGRRGRETSYEVVMAKGIASQTVYDESEGLASGMPLIYSWTLGDGKTNLQTAPQPVYYEDTKQAWQQREGPQVTVRWYAGDAGYGSLMYQVAADSLATYKRRFNFEPTDQIYITIYGSTAAYRTAFPEVPSWSGGFSRYGGVEIVAIAPQNYNSGIFIGEGIPHELSHAALYQFIRSAAPRWLDEGFAVYNQNTADIKEYDELVKKAYQTNTLIPFAKLLNRWPSEEDQARLAYAQSRSMITFLINNYGNEVWSNVLDQLRRTDSDGALKAVFGIELAQMEDLWKTKVLGGGPVTMPTALKRGPVASQPSPADLKSKTAAVSNRDSSDITIWWIILGVLLALLVGVSLGLVMVVAQRERDGLPVPGWFPSKQRRKRQEHDRLVATYLEKFNRPYPTQTTSLPPAAMPLNYNNYTPSEGFMPSVPPPLSGPARYASSENQTSLKFPANSGATEDPFDLIVARFGQNPRSPEANHRAENGSKPGPGLENDPYGLNPIPGEKEK